MYFSYFCSKTDCGFSLEPPWRGGSAKAVLTCTEDLSFEQKHKNFIFFFFCNKIFLIFILAGFHNDRTLKVVN